MDNRKKRSDKKNEIGFSWSDFSNLFEAPEKVDAGKFYQSILFEQPSLPDFNYVDKSDLDLNLKPETDHKWYDIEGDKLEQLLEDNLKNLHIEGDFKK